MFQSSTLRSLIYGGETIAQPHQLDILSLFNVPDTIMQRGFKNAKESQITDTLLDPKIDRRFDMTNGDQFKKFAIDFLLKFNEKEWRKKIRDKIYNPSASFTTSLEEFEVTSSDENKQKYSKTVELLMAYLCVKELKAFTASFGVYIEGAPEGGDYDCIANFQNSLYYFEIKSGDVKNISAKHMQQFLKRHNYLCPEASLLFLDCQDIPVEKIIEFKGLDVTNFNKVGHIMKINNFQGASFYVVCSGVIVVDLGKSGNILSNIRGAMRFIDRHNAQIKRMLHNLMEPKYLDCEGEMI